MTSGIYKFTFPNGQFYIGKSVNMPRRWEQHKEDMIQGRHTAKIQQAFDDNFGRLPDFIILIECHVHHLDILENYFISKVQDNLLNLNTTRSTNFSEEQLILISSTLGSDFWKSSSFDHIVKIVDLKSLTSNLQDQILQLQEDIEEMGITFANEFSAAIDGSKLASKLVENKKLEEKCNRLKNEITRLRSRNWLQRLLNK